MNNQMSLFDGYIPRSRTGYPSRPGAKRDGTSQDAADAIAERAPSLRDRVLAELCNGPGTADELAARIGVSVLAARPRTTELSLAGKITDTGLRRSNDSGRMAIVWGLV